jgi:hypothetical protein
VDLEDIARVVRGVIFALGFGHFFVGGFYGWLRKKMPPYPAGSVKPELTGFIERSFFVVLVAFQVEEAATAMIAWLGVKLAANWQREAPKGHSLEARIDYTFAALLAGLLSMLFALIGGLIAVGKIWPSAG